MKPGYKYLFLLVQFFLVLQLTHCTGEESRHEIANDPVPNLKNRYTVEKTQNVTEKREAVPQTQDDGFQESFRKVRKVHKKLVNKKLSQYDEMEDLERKRIKDSEDAQKKNIKEVQHVIQKMKIIANPNYPADQQNNEEMKAIRTHTSEQTQKPAGGSETQNKVTSSETAMKDESKANEDKENVVSILPSTETKRKSITDSEIEREEESDKADSLNMHNQKKIITSPERKGNKVIRTIYVTEGKNKHYEEEQDDLEAEYRKLKESISSKPETGADKNTRTNISETEEKIRENREYLPKQKKVTEVEEEKKTEPNVIKQSLNSEPPIKIRKIIVRRPVKVIRKNISRSAKEEEQKENRSEEETFVDSEIRTVPIRRKKKIIAYETEKDQSKNTVEGSEDSEGVLEKPEGQGSVKHITIKRKRSGKDTKRSDKTNTEEVEIITNSEEPSLESKIGTISKPKRTARKIVTEIKDNEAGSENDAQENRKKAVKVIDKTDLYGYKNTVENNFNENEILDASADRGKGRQTENAYTQVKENDVDTEKTMHTTEIHPTQLLETDVAENAVPNEGKIRKVSKTTTILQNAVKPRKARTTKKRNEDKYGSATAITKSKAIAEIEKEIHQMLSEVSQTEKPKDSRKPKSSKGSAIVTNKLKSGSETTQNNMKPPDTYINIVDSTDKVHPVLRKENKITISETQEDYLTFRKKPKNVEITTTMPRLIIKDKVLTEVKTQQEDTEDLKPYVDIMESGTANIHQSQNVVVKKIVKPKTSKTNTKINEIYESKTPKIKAKKLIKPDTQKGSVQFIETDTDKKTNIVQDTIEPDSTTVKKSSLIEAEALKKQTQIEAKKQAVETDEINGIKTYRKVVKKGTVPTEDKGVPETRFKIRQPDEALTPASVIVKKTSGYGIQKENDEVSEIEHETKNQLGETEVIDKTGKIPGSRPKVIKRIVTNTMTESQNEHDDTKLKAEDEKVKPVLEFGGTSGSVKKISKRRPETHKEDIVVRETYIEPVKQNEKLPESKTVIVKKVRKTPKADADAVAGNKTAEVKPMNGIENSPESGTEIVERKYTDVDTKTHDAKPTKESGTPLESGTVIVKDVKKVNLNTQKTDTEVDFKDNEPVKTPEFRTVILNTVKKSDSKADNQDSEVDAKNNEVIPIRKTEKSPEYDTGSVRKVNKIDSETRNRDSEDDSEIAEVKTTKENVTFPESRAVVIREAKKMDTETQKDYSEVDTKSHEEKATKHAEKTTESNTVIVRKEKESDLETQTNVSEEDTKTNEIKTINETGKAPESGGAGVKNVKKIDLETQPDVSQDDTKTHEVKTTKETEKVPESVTEVVKKVKKNDLEAQSDVAEDDTKTHELKTTKETEKIPESVTEVVKKVSKIDLETQSDVAESDLKTHEVKTTKETEKVPESGTEVVKKVSKTDLETQSDVAEDDTKTTKETEKVPESNTVTVEKEKIDSETQMGDSKTHEIKTTKETEKSPQSNIAIVKTSEGEKDPYDVPEAGTKGETQSTEATFSKDIETVTKKVRNINMETQKDEADVDTKGDDAKPTREIGTVAIKKEIMTDSETQKEATNVPVVDTESTVPSSEVRPSKDIDNAPKIKNVIVRTVGKTDSETQKEGADVSEINTVINKDTTDVKPDNKLENVPESSTITRKNVIIESETPSGDTEVSDTDRKLKKQTGSTEVKETKEVILDDTYKDKIKDSEVDSIKKKQLLITEQPDITRNLPAEPKTTQETVVSDKVVTEESNKKKEEGIQLPNQPKGETALPTSHSEDSSQIEDDRVVRKDNNFGEVTRITHSITPESEKDNVNTEKKQKNEAVVIKNKNISIPKKTSVASEQVKAKTKAREDQEELVQKDEIMTDTQVIEEEVDDESANSQNVETASKPNSKSISKVAKLEAQNSERRTGMSSPDRDVSKDRATQHIKTGTADKVTAERKAIVPKYSRRNVRGSPLKGREATEFLFLLKNDAEATNINDPAVAAELMNKLRVSKTQNYTTYHVNRGKEWSAKNDLSTLLLRLQISAAKTRSVSGITLSYLETLQVLQKLSSKYIQDGYQASLGTQVKLQIKQFEKLQNAYYPMEIALQNEANVLTEVAVKAISEIRSGMFKMECFKDQYPVFEKFLIPAEPDKKDCYGNVRKLSEWTRVAPELWNIKERRLNKLQASIEKLKKSKEELKPGKNLKKSIAGLLCDIFNYVDVQTKFLNFSSNLASIAKLARREINICNKKEPIDPALADAEK